MSKAIDLTQLSLFPEVRSNETRYLKALAAKALRLQRYWFERLQRQSAPTPEFEFFLDLSRRYREDDVQCGIQLTTGRIRRSKLAWEQAEHDCRKTVAALILKRAKQKIAAVEGKRAVGSVSGAVTLDPVAWVM